MKGNSSPKRRSDFRCRIWTCRLFEGSVSFFLSQLPTSIQVQVTQKLWFTPQLQLQFAGTSMSSVVTSSTSPPVPPPNMQHHGFFSNLTSCVQGAAFVHFRSRILLVYSRAAFIWELGSWNLEKTFSTSTPHGVYTQQRLWPHSWQLECYCIYRLGRVCLISV